MCISLKNNCSTFSCNPRTIVYTSDTTKKGKRITQRRDNKPSLLMSLYSSYPMKLYTFTADDRSIIEQVRAENYEEAIEKTTKEVNRDTSFYSEEIE